MSDPLFEGDDDANTPLEAEEREQLIPSYITIRAELNEAEGVNIGEAMRWLGNRKQSVLDQSYLEEIHKRMFGDVWRWAGSYRKSPRNIGIDAYRIPTEPAGIDRRCKILDRTRDISARRNRRALLS